MQEEKPRSEWNQQAWGVCGQGWVVPGDATKTWWSFSHLHLALLSWVGFALKAPSLSTWWVCVPDQSCVTLCEPTDCSPLDSSVHGIFPARILEWLAKPFSRGSSPPRDRTCISCTAAKFFPLSHLGSPTYKFQFSSVQSLSRVRLFATPWTAARQASLSITNSWSWLKFTSV